MIIYERLVLFGIKCRHILAGTLRFSHDLLICPYVCSDAVTYLRSVRLPETLDSRSISADMGSFLLLLQSILFLSWPPLGCRSLSGSLQRPDELRLDLCSDITDQLAGMNARIGYCDHQWDDRPVYGLIKSQKCPHPLNLNRVASSRPSPSRGATFRRRYELVKSCNNTLTFLGSFCWIFSAIAFINRFASAGFNVPSGSNCIVPWTH